MICVVIGRTLRPLETLAAAFDQVGSGGYHGRLPERGPPELARLAGGFNHMTQRLAAAAAQNSRLNERLLTLQAEERADLIEFLRGTDLLILDAQYTDEEYQRHIGWGHGSISSVVSLAADADAKRLMLFHHDPNHDDETVDKIVDKARMQIAQLGKSIAVEGAREGSELILS